MPKKIIILVLSGFLICSCTVNSLPEQTNSNQPIDITANPVIELEVKTNKSVYSSQENVLLAVEIFSKQNLNNVVVTARGLTGSVGRDYFYQNKDIDLRKNAWQKINLSQQLPVCNSCSGLRPGDYLIRVFVTSQAQILAEKDIVVKINQ